MSTIKLNTIVKFFSIFIILLLLLTFVYSVDENEEAHAYTVPVVIKFINISDDGSCFYSDEVNYTLDQSNNVVYYSIAKKDAETIDNISIECEGIYYDYQVNDQKNTTDIMLSLYSDASKKDKLENRSVKVIYHYASRKTVDLYSDVAVFNYTPWASSKDKVSKLETYITYPDMRENIRIYDNPPHLISSNSWVNRQRHETRYKEITPESNPRQISLISKEAFKSTEYVNVINQPQKEHIINSQDDYASNLAFNNTTGYLLIALSVLFILAGPAITFKYFRNSDVQDFDSKNIEYFDDNYIKVNMILNDKDSVDRNAFYATILELINKKQIGVDMPDDKVSLRMKEYDDKKLEDHERLVLDYLLLHIKDEVVIDKIRNLTDKDELSAIYDNFKSLCKKNYSIKDYLSNKTSRLLKYYCIIAVIYLILGLILIHILNPSLPIFTWSFRSLIVLIPIILFSYILSTRIKDNWNKTGRMHHDMWRQFEGYLNDYSQIEKNPPKSATTWADYIVYSSVMGVDLSFRQNLIRYIDENNKKELLENDLIKLFYYDEKRSLFLVE